MNGATKLPPHNCPAQLPRIRAVCNKTLNIPYESKLGNSRELEISREFPTVPENSLCSLESLTHARQFSGILGGS